MANVERAARLAEEHERFRMMMRNTEYVRLLQPGARSMAERLYGSGRSTTPTTTESKTIVQASPKPIRNFLLLGFQAFTSMIANFSILPLRRRILKAQP